jgi:Bacterial transcriptional regulator
VAEHLVRFTARTIIGKDGLLEELRAIRRNGYAVNQGEWREGVFGIAAPVRDSAGSGSPRACRLIRWISFPQETALGWSLDRCCSGGRYPSAAEIPLAVSTTTAARGLMSFCRKRIAGPEIPIAAMGRVRTPVLRQQSASDLFVGDQNVTEFGADSSADDGELLQAAGRKHDLGNFAQIFELRTDGSRSEIMADQSAFRVEVIPADVTHRART